MIDINAMLQEEEAKRQRLETLLEAAQARKVEQDERARVMQGIGAIAQSLNAAGSGARMAGAKGADYEQLGTIFPGGSESKIDSYKKLLDLSNKRRDKSMDLALEDSRRVTQREQQLADKKADRMFQVGMLDIKEARDRAKTKDPAFLVGDLKQNEFAAAGFANRAEDVNEALRQIPTEQQIPTISENLVQRLPFASGESLIGEKQKIINQLKNDFITAVLREESGAVIGEEEFRREEKKYFPQPGDTAEVLRLKEQARERAVNNLKAQGQRALPFIQRNTPTVKSLPTVKSGVGGNPRTITKNINGKSVMFVENSEGKFEEVE
jgi:hypothetical protein